MKEFTYTVKDPVGIHARPAGRIVAAVSEYKSFITMWKGDQPYDLKKLLTVMGSGLKCGDKIVVRVEGYDEDEALEAVKEALKKNL